MKILSTMLVAFVFAVVMFGTTGCTKAGGGGPVPETNAAGDEAQLPTEESKINTDDPKLRRKQGQTGTAPAGDL